jgi:hypothetical protein
VGTFQQATASATASTLLRALLYRPVQEAGRPLFSTPKKGASPAVRARAALELRRKQQELHADPNLLAFARWSAQHLRIVDKNKKVVPLVLNWAQRQVYATELRMRRERRRPWIIVLKDRKSGISTLQQALAYHAVRTKDNAECRTLAHTDHDTRKIFGIVERFYREEIKHGNPPAKAAGSTYAIRFPSLGSVYDAVTAGATGTGRGGTLWRIHCSEVSRYADAEDLHTALAEGQGTDAAYTWESTANGKEGRGAAFYEKYQEAKAGLSLFKHIFFAWYSHPTNRIALLAPDELYPLTEEEEERVELYGLDLEQVKYWREKRMAYSLKGKGIASMKQEHPDNDEDCFLESGEPYFDRDLLTQRREEDKRPPLRVVEGGPLHGLRVYKKPVEGHDYSMGCDPAEGVDEDESAISVTDHTTGEQVAAWARSDVPPNTLGKVQLKALGYMYTCANGAPAYSTTERNNHGHAVLAAQLDAGYPAHRIYHHVDPTEPADKPSKRVGWPNNSATKGVLVENLGTSLADGVPKIRDEATHASVRRIERNASGTAELTGRDLAVAHALSLFRAPVVHGQPVRRSVSVRWG